ncbi:MULTISPECIES: YbaY family lipoprotein [Yersinia]|uniref:YbaY family lipoprotein n=1 Tax=Yersinia TaxID=629 RepID=UPI0011A807A9|nr:MULTISPECIES: YbaY family lipoprotein [Yersinia]MDA5544461.1 YbaY family lipoprotein [Yersinia rochesterensis]MDN0106621.1 YbaY family lipoprotein [Yersinia rochesterensis]MDR5018763.1 YbaY family lipoprotein [Yersinia rochesterensis]UZM74120.1 YbaY family lipoprotein [Yersinia sp. SCPM-O-B-9106 (C-191)]
MKPWQLIKFWQIVGGAALVVSLAGCAHKGADVPVPASAGATAAPIAQPAVQGTVNIRERIALPPDAIVTVTLSDASLADAPTRVISQKAIRTEGKQAPFSFTLPFNPTEIQPNARIIVSAAITRNGQLLFITDTIQEVINNGTGTQANLLLVPVTSVAIETAPTATTTGTGTIQ